MYLGAFLLFVGWWQERLDKNPMGQYTCPIYCGVRHSHLKFTGKVEKGKLTLHDRDGFKRSLSNYEGDIWLEIKEAPKMHSPKQNAYYRAIIRQLAKELGYTEQELHLTVKKLFKIESTKDLSQEEFSEFLDSLIIHFSQLGYPPEDPRGR